MQPVNEFIPYQLVGSAPNPRFIAHFNWSEMDPAAVHVRFADPSGSSVEWVFARNLIADGISSLEPWGIGDVRINRVTDLEDGTLWLKLWISSPEGEAEVLMRAEPINAFLAKTEAIMPSLVFEGNAEEKKIIAELDFFIESVLSKAEGGQA